MEQSPKEGVKGQQVVVWGSFLPIPLECYFSAPIIALVPLTREEQGGGKRHNECLHYAKLSKGRGKRGNRLKKFQHIGFKKQVHFKPFVWDKEKKKGFHGKSNQNLVLKSYKFIT